MRHIFLLLLLTASLSCFAQWPCRELRKGKDSVLAVLQKCGDDSIRIVLYEELFSYYDVSNDDKMDYANQVLALSSRLNYKKGMGDAYNDLGLAYIDKRTKWVRARDLNKALEYLFLAEDIYQELDNKKGYAGAICNIGLAYYKGYKRDKAIDTFLKVRDILIGINDSDFLAITLTNLGETYYSKKKYIKAIEAATTAKIIYDRYGIKCGAAGANLQIAWCHARLKQYAEAEEYANKGLALAHEAGDAPLIKYGEGCLKYIHKKRRAS